MNQMGDWLTASAERAPADPFLITPAQTWSFGEVEELVCRAVGALRRLGVKRGEIVAVWGENDVDTVVGMLAVPRTGALVLPLNTRLAEEEVEALVKRAGVTKVLSSAHAPKLGLETLPLKALAGGPADRRCEVVPHDGFMLMFTSGTTGQPKCVRLSRANLEASAAASARHLGHTREDRWLAVLPVFHVGGWSIIVRSAREGSAVVLEPRFESARAGLLMREGRVTLVSLVTMMLERILDIEPGPYWGVRAVLLGGGPSTQDLLDRSARARLPVLPTYGMTETASQVATLPLAEGLEPTLELPPLDNVRLRVVSGAGNRLRANELGSIEVHGPMVSAGYLGEPAHLPSHWFHTGDFGRIDADGRLTVIGRTDDIIISGGENIHPVEVEQILLDHPDVDDVVVVGLPDPEWGEIVAGAVVGSAGPKVRDLEAHVRLHLAGFKVPRRWRFVDELPRNSLGKVARSEVVEWFTDGGPER
ncbi:MAG TPA: AMP-binding protein [Acidimicrobiia bacterium]|nr:AMP-binding protein [Acidimicrobiia bacterium]